VNVGIERLDLYAGRWALSIEELVRARGGDLDYVRNRVMSERRSVYPVYEDAVTLAVNAARRLLAGTRVDDIEMLVVGTESAVDFGKPISGWVHRLCGLSPNCRSFEVKHACYGGTAALQTAASWVASGVRPGKKALVISTDLSRPPHSGRVHLTQTVGTHSPEFILGGCAVAAIVGDEPAVLELERERAGYWTQEIADTFRPTSRDEEGNQIESLCSYLDALDGAYDHFETVVGSVDYDAMFKKHIYHVPFPAMAREAHGALLGRFGADKAALRASFAAKVEDGLHFAKQIGTSYGASTFVCLLGLLQGNAGVEAGDRISVFAYGSGCQGELYSAVIGTGAHARVQEQRVQAHLDDRAQISVELYDRNEEGRDAIVDQRDFTPERTLGDLYERTYAGRGLLVLEAINGFRREYAWS
jgi:hydroxymethylglutaryl-CoA synthase